MFGLSDDDQMNSTLYYLMTVQSIALELMRAVAYEGGHTKNSIADNNII